MNTYTNPTSIRATPELVQELEKLKIIKHEPLHSVIERLMKVNEQHNRLCLKKVKQ